VTGASRRGPRIRFLSAAAGAVGGKVGDPVGLSKARGQPRPDDQHLPESDPLPAQAGQHPPPRPQSSAPARLPGPRLPGRPRPDLRQRLLVLIQRERHRLGQRRACVAVANQLLRALWTMAPTGRLCDGRIELGIVRGEAWPSSSPRLAHSSLVHRVHGR